MAKSTDRNQNRGQVAASVLEERAWDLYRETVTKIGSPYNPDYVAQKSFDLARVFLDVAAKQAEPKDVSAKQEEPKEVAANG